MQTHWQVITGGPCSGKTTIINALREQGYHCEPEVARKYLELIVEWQKEHHLKRSPLAAQYAILEAKLARERRLSPDELVFFDRGMPDSVAYFEFSEMDVDDAVEACAKQRYERVFHLEQLPFENDGVRKETPEQAKMLSELILKAYRSVGYEPIVVPAVSVEERVEMILNSGLSGGCK